MEKIWKDIPGFVGVYQVSNTGKIYSVKKNIILRPSISDRGYLHVVLYNKKTKKNLRINRIVAEAFIPNPENKPLVNHKNGIKTDNRVENLEWVTDGENKIHSYRILKNTPPRLGKTGELCSCSKPVLQIKNGVIIARFVGLAEAQRQTGTAYQLISGCCRGKHKTANGFSWKYDN